MIIGPWRNQVKLTLPIKLVDILRCLDFSKKKLDTKKPPSPPPKNYLEIQLEMNLFDFFLILTKTNHNRKFTSKYITLYGKMLLERILDLGKCPNQKVNKNKSKDFLVWALFHCIFKKWFGQGEDIFFINKKNRKS